MSQKTVRKKPRKNKKFRFQLLREWINKKYQPGRLADIGGGKGLLAYLLRQDGWQFKVVDPERTLPLKKYKDEVLGKRVKLAESDWKNIDWIEDVFKLQMAKDFDLLVSLHGHGVNMKIIEACAQYGCDFVLVPCCVIDEPIIKKPAVDWFDSLNKYAASLGIETETAKLNFKGKNRILFSCKHHV